MTPALRPPSARHQLRGGDSVLTLSSPTRIILPSFNTNRSAGKLGFMVTVLYFARLREALGRSSETVALPAAIRDVEGVRALLVARGGEWEQELAPSKPVRAAVNQALAHGDTPVSDGDEIAFFPPVTGG